MSCGSQARMSRSQGAGRQASGFSAASATSQGASGATTKVDKTLEIANAQRHRRPLAGQDADQRGDREQEDARQRAEPEGAVRQPGPSAGWPRGCA